MRGLRSRSVASRMSAAAGMAGALLLAGPSPFASAGRGRPDLRLRERLVQSLTVDGGADSRRVELRETRRLRVDLRAALPGIDPDALGAATPFGIRLGDYRIEADLGSDPRWRPGRRSVRLVLEDADKGTRGVLKVRWSAFDLRATGRVAGRAPYAEVSAVSPAGTVKVNLDSALRFGDEAFRFGGSVTGEVRRHGVVVLDNPVDLARVSLEGRGRALGIEEDGSAPVVAITSPASGAILPPDGFALAGTLRDDRSLARVTCSLDGGPEVDTAFSLDPASGYLRDLEGTFASSGPIAVGAHDVVVRAFDAAGNSGLARVEFFVSVPPPEVPLAAGDGSAAAVDAAGGVFLWGYNVATMAPGQPYRPTPVRIPGLQGSIAVANSIAFTLALQPDGTVRAVGDNTYGELGDGTTDPSAIPVTVAGLTGVKAIAAGLSYGMALRSDGTVWTWGRNDACQLGDGTTTDRSTPAPVAGLPPIRAIAPGFAVGEDGRVWSWPYAWPGGTSPLPAAIEGPEDIVSVSPGGAVLAVAASGEVWSWGGNNRGQCGRGVSGAGMLPGKIPGITTAVATACGYFHSLILLQDGTVLATGYNGSGQLGDGTTAGTQPYAWRNSPEPVPGLDQVRAIAASYEESYAVRADGSVRAWGRNGMGQLGDGTYVDRHSPVPVPLE